MTDFGVAIVIPAYNAEKTIRNVVEGCAQFVFKSSILVIDDGSTDATEAIARQVGAIVLVHPCNSGKGAAIKTGIEYCLKNNFTGVITLDADLQHDPKSVGDFLRKASQNKYDILVGTRNIKLPVMPFSRYLTNNITSVIISITGGSMVRDSQSGFRYYHIEAIKNLRVKSLRYDYESELLIQAARLGLKIGAVPIATIYQNSRSFIKPWTDTGRFVRILWRTLWW